MSDESNPLRREPEPTPENERYSIKKGIALGCATNAVLILAVPFFFLGLSNFVDGDYLMPALFGAALITNGVIIFRAYRRRDKGIVIGFAIALSLAILLEGMCFSSLGS